MGVLNIILFGILVFNLGCAVNDTSPSKTKKPLICTRDLNQWGYSSNCKCEGSAIYDQKIGKCIES